MVVIVLGGTLLVSGCAKSGPAFVEDGNSYTKASVLALLDKADTSAYKTQDTANAPALRHKALAALQSRGAAAQPAVDLLVKTFPADTLGVPVYVELAKVDGRPATILIEAVGPKTGKLVNKRLWAFDASGTVIVAGTR
jgi:hypothetical protein